MVTKMANKIGVYLELEKLDQIWTLGVGFL